MRAKEAITGKSLSSKPSLLNQMVISKSSNAMSLKALYVCNFSAYLWYINSVVYVTACSWGKNFGFFFCSLRCSSVVQIVCALVWMPVWSRHELSFLRMNNRYFVTILWLLQWFNTLLLHILLFKFILISNKSNGSMVSLISCRILKLNAGT